MRRVIAVGLAALFIGTGLAVAGTVEVKGPHICCGQCVKVVGKLLANVEGVSDVKADQQAKTVTFTAADAKAAKAGIKALTDGGFFGAATEDGKEIKLKLPTPKKGETADVVVVKGVHMCCGQCRTAATKLFKDSKVSFEGKGPQQDVRIEGTGLDRAGVIEALRKAGFNGTVEK